MKNPIILLLFLFAAVVTWYTFYVTNKPTTLLETPQKTIDVNEVEPTEASETDLDKLIGLGKVGLEKADEILEKKRIRDSIQLANREEILVYQIGMPKSSPEALWSTYKKLQGYGNICLVKASKRSYYLIKHEGYTKDEIESNKNEIEKRMQGMNVSEEIRIVDLSSLCIGNNEVKMGRDEKVNKEKIACYVCR